MGIESSKDTNVNYAVGFGMGVCADLIKYASLLYGISRVVGNEPELDKAIYAGFAYGVASILSIAGTSLRNSFVINSSITIKNKSIDGKGSGSLEQKIEQTDISGS